MQLRWRRARVRRRDIIRPHKFPSIASRRPVVPSSEQLLKRVHCTTRNTRNKSQIVLLLSQTPLILRIRRGRRMAEAPPKVKHTICAFFQIKIGKYVHFTFYLHAQSPLLVMLTSPTEPFRSLITSISIIHLQLIENIHEEDVSEHTWRRQTPERRVFARPRLKKPRKEEISTTAAAAGIMKKRR